MLRRFSVSVFWTMSECSRDLQKWVKWFCLFFYYYHYRFEPIECYTLAEFQSTAVTLFNAQITPSLASRSPLRSALCQFTSSNIYFSSFLVSQTIPGSSWTFPAPRHNQWSFWEMELRDHNLDARMLSADRLSLLLGLYSGWSYKIHTF